MHRLLIVSLLALSWSNWLQAADWPMYRNDSQRGGYTQENLPEGLSLVWKYESTHVPQRAWPRSDRQQFDACYQPVVLGGRLYFGSSADGKLTCLDASTGSTKWTFFTGGPIRLAPVAWGNRLAVASDDGQLYVLDATTGELVWKHRGGPERAWRLGNEKMISKWPARGGPVMADGVLYYAAGIWPSDGIYLHALDADSGKVLWTNSDSGGIYMPQPHGGANAASGVSAQGHLAVYKKKLIVPTGRAVPAAFDRETGKLAYFHLATNRAIGGTLASVVGDYLYNGGIAFDATSGVAKGKTGAVAVASLPEGLVLAKGNTLSAHRWIETEKPDRKGKLVKVKALETLWTAAGIPAVASLIVAGDKVIAGAAGQVTMVDGSPAKSESAESESAENGPKTAQVRKPLWTAEVVGVAHGLAAADGKLFVSTDRGQIYCFAAGEFKPAITGPKIVESPYKANRQISLAAEEIIKRTETTKGYCLDLGCGDGQLAFELAKRTSLIICAVDDDPQQVALARKKLDAAGLYGTRVTVHLAELSSTGLPKYFANLIVSRRALAEPLDATALREAERVQRPYGGLICQGTLGDMHVAERGVLAGAGSWTHQYSNPANTVNSDDALVQGSLGILWFRDVDLDLPSRHGRGPAPLFHQGRLFHEGLDEIRAVDAYNGRVMWSYRLSGVLRPYDGDHLMGVAGTGSNYCVSDQGVFARHEDRCVQIDPATGEELGEFVVPADGAEKSRPWGYIASDAGTLFGTRANPDHVVTYRYKASGDLKKQLTESKAFFAYDVETKKLKWKYEAEHSIRHNAIAIGSEHVFLIDRPAAQFDLVKKSPVDQREHPQGVLLALDKNTGKVIWKDSEAGWGTLLAVSNEHKTLLVSYQPTRFKLDSEVGGRLATFDVADGKRRWSQEAKYASRPTLNGRTIYAEGGAWDLLTGKTKPFNFKRSYGCGVISSSKNMFFFRSATLGYFDLTKNDKVENFGGVRPGCWINAIPAGGLVLVPDASAACTCSYLNRSWFALEPLEPSGKESN